MKEETRRKLVELTEQIEKLEGTFGAFDWAIVVVYLVATVAIGLYVNRYIRNMSDYVVAGRSLKSFLAIATMVGTELGLITVMYAAQKGFTKGFAAFHIGLVAGVVTLIVGFTGFIVVPLRRMGVMTIPEFYEKRFGRGVRVFGGLLLAAAGILNMGLFLKAGAIFLTALTGLTDPTYVKLVMTALITLVLTYTILGGMISVVITDYVQFVILSFGMLLACALAYMWHNANLRPIFFEDGAVVDDTVLTLYPMPVFLRQILPVGLLGLVGAGMLAAFMSTHDSYLLCWSSVIVQDVVDPCLRRPLSTRARLTMARVLIFLIGLFLLIWSLWYPLELDLWDYMAVSGAIYFTGAFALLLAGLYWKRASRAGAYLALMSGACAVLGLKPVKNGIADALCRAGVDCDFSGIASEHVGLATAALALALMFFGSLLFPDKRTPAQVPSEKE